MSYRPYEAFDRFIYRAPLLPINFNNHDFFKSDLFKESIFLASPDLYDAIVKEEHKNFNDLDIKTKLSVLKYIIRMKYRCTPFGLFAGCGVGEIRNKPEIFFEGIINYSSHTRLDMNYLCALTQYISSIERIRDKLYFYPNTSLYKLGNGYRYVEYTYVNSNRKHLLSEIEYSPYVEEVIRQAEKGVLRKELIQNLSNNDIEKEEAGEFIDALISNQVLISELEASVTGEDMLQQMINTLKKIDKANELVHPLETIKSKLDLIDSNKIGRSQKLYKEIETEIQKLPIQYDRKFLFQSDLSITSPTTILSTTIIDSVMEGVHILNRLTVKRENSLLKKFKEDFYKRYEEEEIPLVEALDVDIVIGFYNLSSGNADINPLVDDIPIVQKDNNPSVSTTPIDIFLMEKYNLCLTNGLEEVIITEEEIKNFPGDWEDLPFTISTLIEVASTGNKDSHPLIVIKHTGGSSAANLLGRFCHINNRLHQHVKEIIDKENELVGKDKILAEIVHLPESRMGNILYRPQLRSFEIPYLAKPSVKEPFTVSISDLMISIKGGKEIQLRSKKLNKEIIPRLTTAHNFSRHSLPIYHFLCELQTEGLRRSLQFDWGTLLKKKEYLPRVRYKNIILSPATWNISAQAIKPIPKITDQLFLEHAITFKKEKKLPDKVLLTKGDNKLLIDFNDPLSIQLLFSEVKGNDFVLEEYFLNTNHALVKRNNEVYNNEVILSLYKNIKTSK